MSDEPLPPGWARVEIKDLISADGVFVDGDWIESKDQDPDGDVRLIQLADIGEGAFLDKSARFLTSAKADELRCTFLKKGDVLVARMPDPLGRACIFPLEDENRFVTVVDVCIIRTSAEIASPEFLTSAINFLGTRKQIEDLQTGTTRRRISRGNLANVTIPLPPPAEQKRIVVKSEELFSELEAGEESLRVARRQLGVYRQSLLKQAFEGKLTAQWRTQNPAKLESPMELLARIQSARQSRYELQVREWISNGRMGKKPSAHPAINPLTEDESVFLRDVPGAWRAVPSEAIGDVQLGRQRSPKNQSKDYPTKYIRAANITESGLALDDILEMEFTPQERKTFTLQPGDIVLSEASGSASQVGKPAMWRGEIPDCCFQNTVIRHRLFDREQSVFYLWLYRYFYLHGIFARTAGGVGINHLSAGKFSRLPVPLCSLPEQQEIVRLLDEQFEVIERNEREIDAALKRSEALRQAILKKAFTGRLVPQHAGDEPAAKLLERIRIEREASKQTNKPKVRAKPRVSRPTETQSLIEVLRDQSTWISAQKAFERIGIGRSSSTSDIDAAYDQLRNSLGQIEVKRRGNEDWLRMKKRRSNHAN